MTEDEADQLRDEVLDSMRKVSSYHAGNTALLGALMNLVAGIPGADMDATKLLRDAGMLDAEGEMNWMALKDREEKPMTWPAAVRKFVKNPAEQERLLALK